MQIIVWNRLFGDSYDEYQRLSSINPYFPREHGGCIYPYFFDMEVEGELILDTLGV